jgi:hypothetical protein
MDWEAELKEIKMMALWIVVGLFIVVNSGYVGIEWLGRGSLGELIMVNMSLVGWTLIGWGVLSFILNTVKIILKDSEKEVILGDE